MNTMFMNPMSQGEIRAAAPAVFATEAHPSMSSRYGFFNTGEILNIMANEGYVTVEAKQDPARRRLPGYVRHQVKLVHEDALNNKSKLLVGEVIPTINLINSHNGKSKFHLFSGMFRLVCSNGLIIADKGNAEMEQMRHAASLVDEVIKRMRAAAARVTQTTRQIEHWRNVELSETEVTAFATRALELRFGESAKAYDVETALQTRRDEDAGRTMWRVLNRVQENLSKGGVIGRSALGRQIRSRALNGITADVAFNKGIWELAEGIAG